MGTVFAADVIIAAVVVVVIVVVDDTKELTEKGMEPDTDRKPLVPKFVELKRTELFVLVTSLLLLLVRMLDLLVAIGAIT